MLTYSFENIGSDHMYEYLYRCIREDILSHKLSPDVYKRQELLFGRIYGLSERVFL